MTSSASQIDAVTGAFSYSGAAIARELLGAGHQVRTLTGHPGRAPEGTGIEAHALDFADPDGLRRSLHGVHTLYNTYWVRFARGQVSHQEAVANSKVLFDAAARAGVRRIVHVSITNPSLDSPYPYFRGKAEVEQYLAGTGLPCAIARPAILFGGPGVLVNNVAWLLRHLPVFAIGGHGGYPVRGIHVDDLARLCAELGRRSDTVTLDAVGPQSVTFKEMVLAIRSAVGSRAVIVPVPASLIPALSGALGLVLHDVLLTRQEYQAMAAGLAGSDAPPTGEVVFTDWIREHGSRLGLTYANELDLHFRAG
jgi:uncharacterized protein YbjT (DUF2867 family)